MQHKEPRKPESARNREQRTFDEQSPAVQRLDQRVERCDLPSREVEAGHDEHTDAGGSHPPEAPPGAAEAVERLPRSATRG